MINKELSLKSAIEQAKRCLLCYDPICSKVCKKSLDPAKVIRSIRFGNEKGAALHLASLCQNGNSCKQEGEAGIAACIKGCLRGRIDEPVAICQLMDWAYRKGIEQQQKERGQTTTDIEKINPKGELNIATESLEVTFCGVKCENPFFLASSPVANSYQMCAHAFRAGWAGAAFKTIGLKEMNEVSPRFDQLQKESVPFIGFKNMEQISEKSPEENFEIIRRLKKEFPQKVLIVSIMGENEQEWTELATRAEAAGADIIECNFSCPQMTTEGMGCDIGQNPDLVRKFTAATRQGTTLPILAKMTPNQAEGTTFAITALDAGATGVAAINTVKCITHIDRYTFTGTPDIAGKSSVSGYSGKAIKPIALRFVKELSDQKIQEISGIGGIETWQDALEFILLGASTVQICTAVMQYGYRIIDDLKEGLLLYMQEQGVKSLSEIRGKAIENMILPRDLNRETKCYPVFNTNTCIGCGRCYISCSDGGHSAILWGERAIKRPTLNKEHCVGCLLCAHVCPTGAISQGERVSK